MLDGFGVSFKNKLYNLGKWGIGLGVQGEMLLNCDNQVQLYFIKKDKWGMFQLSINCKWLENEIIMMEYVVDVLVKMLQDVGFGDIKVNVNYLLFGLVIYEVGLVRMGCDLKDLVLNGYNQVYDVLNLFVIDGVSYCLIGVGNLLIIFMVLIVCVVDYVVKEFKVGRL